MQPTMPKSKMKYLLKLFCIVIILYLFIFYIIWEVLFSKKMQNQSTQRHHINLSHVIVHLDLKGAPPKLNYLHSLLPMLKNSGATGLLLEYEDMFPYEGKLANLSARNCYGKEELHNFIQSATASGLEVIPLVQTFGHMESALKLQEFQHLREQTSYPDSICPSRIEGRALVAHMLEQVLEFHKRLHKVKFVHIGCDEVFRINSCGACRRRMLDKEQIFLQHVITTSAEIKKTHPDITVLIWDDMLRGIPPLILRKYSLNKYIEPVVWDYKPSVDITHAIIFKYYNNFDNIWIASAFKGADKKATTLPDFTTRYMNHFSWMRFINGYKMAGQNGVFNFKGIFLTGWSRFSHFDPLCEILPVSVPSLLVSLLTIEEYVKNYVELKLVDGGGYLENKIFQKVYMKINCTKTIKIYKNIMEDCKFYEVELYKLLFKLNETVNSVINEEKELNFVNGDLLDFYIENRHVNPGEVLNIQNKFVNFQIKLNAITDDLRKLLDPYFDIYVITEYVKYKLYVKDIVLNVLKNVDKIKKLKTWEAGPIIFKEQFNKTVSFT